MIYSLEKKNEIVQTEMYSIYLLTKELAKKFQREITQIWNLVPLANHKISDILQEEKNGKHYLGKWKHSLIMLSPDKVEVYGFIVGHERRAESNDVYSTDSLHLKSLSISQKYQKQGLGRKLLETWLNYSRQLGYLHLSGKFVFSAQTNGAAWNAHVQNFYQEFGFVKTGSKKYQNKIDNVFLLDPQELV